MRKTPEAPVAFEKVPAGHAAHTDGDVAPVSEKRVLSLICHKASTTDEKVEEVNQRPLKVL